MKMRIVMTGATGFIGKELGKRLAFLGHDLVVLTRNTKHAAGRLPFPCEAFEWDAASQVLPAAALQNADAVIHLAGEPIASSRWTESRKEAILESRSRGTRNVVDGIAAMAGKKPSVLVSASAIGIYGDRGDEILNEESGLGQDFLAEVCKRWEKEAARATALGVRVCTPRIGLVLGSGGGALEKMIPPFKKGIGGRLGSGRQWMSWIHLEDLVSLIVEAVTHSSWSGPFNAVAPHPVTNSEFTLALGGALRVPTILPLPGIALKTIFGELASALLSGARVSSEKAQSLGFRFKFERVENALGDICSPGCEEFRSDQWVPRPVEDIFPFFSEAKNLETLTPPWLGFRIVSQSTPAIEQGTLIDYKLKIHGVPVTWRSRIEEWVPNTRFIDNQLKGPYSLWHHTHEFRPMKGGTLLSDRVLFKLPAGFLGDALAGWKVRSDVKQIFDYRSEKIRELMVSESQTPK